MPAQGVKFKELLKKMAEEGRDLNLCITKERTQAKGKGSFGTIKDIFSSFVYDFELS